MTHAKDSSEAQAVALAALTMSRRDLLLAALAGTALAALAALPVKGRAPRTKYEREVFGQAWADADRNGCDTRNDVLRRDLTAYVLKAGTRGCLVLRGTLRDPYTGASIAFVRGPVTSREAEERCSDDRSRRSHAHTLSRIAAGRMVIRHGRRPGCSPSTSRSTSSPHSAVIVLQRSVRVPFHFTCSPL